MTGKGPRSWDGQRETLDDLSDAIHYNRWIFSLMEPYLGKRTLELGCGIGNMTGSLAEKGRVLAMDVNPDYLAAAKRVLKGRPGVAFRRLELPGGLSRTRSFRPDGLVCVNVLEHIREDGQLLANCRKVLPEGGKALFFVPALPWLYGSMDRTYGHHRRYTKEGLESLMRQAGFEVTFCRYLNLLGILGWWLNGKVLGRRVLPRGQMFLYDQVVRFTGRIEKWLPRPIGLSLFCVGTKRGGTRG